MRFSSRGVFASSTSSLGRQARASANTPGGCVFSTTRRPIACELSVHDQQLTEADAPRQARRCPRSGTRARVKQKEDGQKRPLPSESIANLFRPEADRVTGRVE